MFLLSLADLHDMHEVPHVRIVDTAAGETLHPQLTCATVSTAFCRLPLSASDQAEEPKVCGRYWYAGSRRCVSALGSGWRPAADQKRDAPLACVCTVPGFVPAVKRRRFSSPPGASGSGLT